MRSANEIFFNDRDYLTYIQEDFFKWIVEERKMGRDGGKLLGI